MLFRSIAKCLGVCWKGMEFKNSVSPLVPPPKVYSNPIILLENLLLRVAMAAMSVRSDTPGAQTLCSASGSARRITSKSSSSLSLSRCPPSGSVGGCDEVGCDLCDGPGLTGCFVFLENKEMDGDGLHILFYCGLWVCCYPVLDLFPLCQSAFFYSLVLMWQKREPKFIWFFCEMSFGDKVIFETGRLTWQKTGNNIL